MEFITKTANRYKDLPRVTITHQSDELVIINVDQDLMKSIHVVADPFYGKTLFQVIPQGEKGYVTLSESKAREQVWMTYLDMVGDLV